jgi:hypothetical protein
MNKIKSFKIFENKISDEYFETFVFDVVDTFSELIDDEVVSNNGAIEYQDDSVMVTLNKPKRELKVHDVYNYDDTLDGIDKLMLDIEKEKHFYEDIQICVKRLSDKYKLRTSVMDFKEVINLIVTLVH